MAELDVGEMREGQGWCQAREQAEARAGQARFRSWVFFFLRALGSLCSSPKEGNAPYALKPVWRSWARLTPTSHPLSEDKGSCFHGHPCGQRSVSLRQSRDKELGQDVLSAAFSLEESVVASVVCLLSLTYL